SFLPLRPLLCEVTSVSDVKSTEVSLPPGSRTLNESPERKLTTPWTFCFCPCGTCTGWALLALCPADATADISVITKAKPTSTVIDALLCFLTLIGSSPLKVATGEEGGLPFVLFKSLINRSPIVSAEFVLILFTIEKRFYCQL